MRKELKRIAEELTALYGAQAVVLPYPYKRGHFRLYTQREIVPNEEYTARRCGNNVFVTLTDAGLMRALREMEESAPEVCVAPQDSPLDTLLYQLMRKGYEMRSVDEPELARMALDLDEDAARSRVILENMEKRMRVAYADALREDRQYSTLTALARQVAHYRNSFNIGGKA